MSVTANTTRCRSHDPERLYRRRVAAGLKMQELADRAGLAKSTISNAENGSTVWPETLHAIAQGLDCDVADLMWPTEGAPE